jgi:hypothetical protein
MDWSEIEKEVAAKTVDALKSKNIALSEGVIFASAETVQKDVLGQDSFVGDVNMNVAVDGGCDVDSSAMNTSTFRNDATVQLLAGEVSRLQTTVREQAQRMKSMESMMATFGDALENQGR